MSLKIVHGQITKIGKKEGDFFKQRVSVVAIAEGGLFQMISAGMLLRIQSKPVGHAPVYEGPTMELWHQLLEKYPDETQGLQFIGVLAAATHGPFAGHIDWVQPIEKHVPKEVMS